MYTISKVRELFINYFKNLDHVHLKSASLFPAGDKSIMFTNSGMAPLKDYFTGVKKVATNKAVSCQKCLRTVDIENVGKTNRHGTFLKC